MISAFKFIKPAILATPMLAAACLTLAGQIPAQASTVVQRLVQADIPSDIQARDHALAAPPYVHAVPADMMRGSDKWIGNLSLKDLAADTAPVKKAAAPASLYFKPATPGWIDALDAASYMMTLTVPVTFDILPSGNRPPPPNIQSPLK